MFYIFIYKFGIYFSFLI